MSAQTFPMLIGGRPHVPDRPVREIRSPGDGALVGLLRLGTAEDVDNAVAAARAAAPRQRASSVFDRSALCREIAHAIGTHREELAKQLALEHGKPLHAEALGEIDGVVTAFHDAADQIVSLRSESMAVRDPNKRVLLSRRPRGVYSVITPWNFPLGVAATYYLAPGIAAGNTLVWTPAPSVSGIAVRLAEVLHETALPPGVLNVVTGEGPVVGDVAIRHEGVNAVGFTGSTPTGKLVAEAAAGKPLQLELGGNGPSIVFDDADLDVAAAAIAGGAYANAGQICTSPERILAHDSVAGQLAEGIAEYAAKIQLGNPLETATTMGPVHTAEGAARACTQIEQAVAAGARVLTGGGRPADAPTEHYVQATVVDDVPAEADLHVAETFAPVAPIVHFHDRTQLHELVAASHFGLSGALFSRDIGQAIPLAEQLPCGIVNLNKASSYWEPNIPAGGTSDSGSGYGRTGGPWSIEEMTEQQAVVIATGEH